MNTWRTISSKKFLSFIIEILKSQNDAEIQTKLLQLIQNWGTDFESKKNVIPNFYKIYNKFRVNGVVFPPREEPNYYKYILRNDEPKQNDKNDDYYEDGEVGNDLKDNNEFAYIDSIKNKLKTSNFEHKYRRLVAFLVKMHDNIKLANIYIDKRKINDLKEPINTIKKGNKTIMDTITSGRLKDEKLMEITLGTTEDINQTLAREDEMKAGNRPKNFISYFILNEIIPITNNNMRSRAKSEKKKGALLYNPKNNMNRNEDSNNNNKNNINDIFDLFSVNNQKGNNENPSYNNLYNNNNNNQNNNIISNFYSNQNTNNNFFDENNGNNNFNNYNNNRRDNNINSSKSLNPNNFNNRNNQMNNLDLLGESLNINNQQNHNFKNMNNNNNNNFQNMNNNQNNKFKSNEFDMYGPAPEINSNELVNYIGSFNNNNNNNNNFNNNNNNYKSNSNFNNNNQYPSFGGNNQNNNMLFQNNQGNNNTMEQNYCNNNGPKIPQDELEDLF